MNPFFSTGHLALWLLFAGLFFPRLALMFAWLGTGTYPPNDIPNLLNFVLWLLVPRFLMAFYIFTDQGVNNFWFWAYVVTGVIGSFGESGLVKSRMRSGTKTTRCKTVAPDGTTTTTTTTVKES